MARKRRTAVEGVQPTRPESAGIDLDAIKARGAHGGRQLLERRAALPPGQQMSIQLDSSEIAMVPDAEVTGDAEVPERILRAFDLVQPLWRDSGTIR